MHIACQTVLCWPEPPRSPSGCKSISLSPEECDLSQAAFSIWVGTWRADIWLLSTDATSTPSSLEWSCGQYVFFSATHPSVKSSVILLAFLSCSGNVSCSCKYHMPFKAPREGRGKNIHLFYQEIKNSPRNRKSSRFCLWFPYQKVIKWLDLERMERWIVSVFKLYTGEIREKGGRDGHGIPWRSLSFILLISWNVSQLLFYTLSVKAMKICRNSTIIPNSQLKAWKLNPCFFLMLFFLIFFFCFSFFLHYPQPLSWHPELTVLGFKEFTGAAKKDILWQCILQFY